MKLLESKYYPNSGFSTVILKHNGKTYIGNAFYNEEGEKNPPNSFFGQRLAEKRAMIKYWKEKKNINRIKQEALQSLQKDLINTIPQELQEQEGAQLILKKIQQHTTYYWKEKRICWEKYDTLKREIKESLKIREQLFNKVKNS